MPFARDDFGRAEEDLLRVYAPFRGPSARSRSPVVFSVSMTFRIPPSPPPMTAGCAPPSNDSLAVAEKSGASAFREGGGGERVIARDPPQRQPGNEESNVSERFMHLA